MYPGELSKYVIKLTATYPKTTVTSDDTIVPTNRLDPYNYEYARQLINLLESVHSALLVIGP